MVESIFAGEQTLLEGWWNWVRLHQHQLAHLLEEHVFLTKETFIHFIQQLADTSIDPPLEQLGPSSSGCNSIRYYLGRTSTVMMK